MVRNLLTISLILLSQFAIGRTITITLAGSSTITSTNYTINGSTTTAFSPALVEGDIVQISGSSTVSDITYHTLIFDTTFAPLRIVWLPGSVITSPRASGYKQPHSYDMVNVSIEDMNSNNWWGSNFKSYNVHNVTWLRCKWYNPPGSNIDQVAEFWDDAGTSAMQFSGSKSQTFYRNAYIDCKFDGFNNSSALQFGSNWGSSAEINRSIILDQLMLRDTIQNINQNSGTNISGFSGTGFNLVVSHCEFNQIAGDTSGHNAHNGTITWYGTVSVINCHQTHSYAQLLRSYTLAWTGLPGYRSATTAIVFAGNIIEHQLGYSGAELGMNGVGNHDNAHGFYQCKSVVVYNTVYSTHRNLTGGAYFAGVCDVVNIDSIEAKYNLIVYPERDYTYDSVGRGYGPHGYIVMVISSNPTITNIANNKTYPTFNTNELVDSVAFVPGPLTTLGSAGTSYTYISTDFYGNALTRLAYGAVNPASGSVPSCVTNISPGNGTTVAGQTSAALSWNSDGTATSYDLYFDGAFLLNQSGTTYTKTGLSANTGHSFYAIPRNASGPAVSCSGNSTSFTTASVPIPSCVTNTLPTAGSTIGTTTTASLAWNSDAAATSYSVYLYLNGGSIPGTPTTTISGTTYSATGLTAGLVYKFFVIPNSTGGSASGCSTNATIFSTAAIGHPVKILTVRRK
jgi:hypothetical protein